MKKLVLFCICILTLINIRCVNVSSINDEIEEIVIRKAIEYPDIQKYLKNKDSLDMELFIMSNDLLNNEDNISIFRYGKRIPIHYDSTSTTDSLRLIIEITELIKVNNHVRLMFGIPSKNKIFGFAFEYNNNDWIIKSFLDGDL